MARNAGAEYRKGGLLDYVRLPAGALEAAQAETRPDIDRVALADALRAYHRDLGTLTPTVEAHLTRLAHPASRVVVTGQQAGALTGPAYSVHKGADAALLARQLDTEDAPVAAVYWIASQDHDAAEVAGTSLLDAGERLHRLNLDVPEGVPVGRVPWRPEWTAQVHALLDAFDAPAEHVAAVRARFDRAVQAGGSYADVFARLIHGLLGGAGLLVLDPMHPALARLMAPRQVVGFSDGSAAAERLDLSVPLSQVGGLHEVERVFAPAAHFGIGEPIPPLTYIRRSVMLRQSRSNASCNAFSPVSAKMSATPALR